MSEISSPPIGVAAALASATPTRTALNTFSLVGRVALVTGGHRGIGLEIALALVEEGAIVYCLDIHETPDENWHKVQKYAAQLPSLGTSPQGKSLNGQLEYISADVTDQTMMWAKAEDIVKLEGRLDICFANAGMLREADCLDYPADEFQKVGSIQFPFFFLLTMTFTIAYECQRQWCFIHCAGCWSTDGKARYPR
jgi:NAD(P)-dependent dehydrogenase (short-subunit alcohol dehydrogenase family)